MRGELKLPSEKETIGGLKMLIEIDQNRFVNPFQVFAIELKILFLEGKENYYWVFYPSNGTEETVITSKTFDSEEEARKWLLSIFPAFRT